MADLTLAAYGSVHLHISQGQQWKDCVLACMSTLSPSCGPAGSYGRQLLDGSGESLKLQPWQIALGLAFIKRGECCRCWWLLHNAVQYLLSVRIMLTSSVQDFLI